MTQNTSVWFLVCLSFGILVWLVIIGYHWLQHVSRRHRGMTLTVSDDMLRTMDGAFFCVEKKVQQRRRYKIS